MTRWFLVLTASFVLGAPTAYSFQGELLDSIVLDPGAEEDSSTLYVQSYIPVPFVRGPASAAPWVVFGVEAECNWDQGPVVDRTYSIGLEWEY